MKPKIKGNLAELYAAKATLRRDIKTGQYVEFIGRHEYSIERNADGTTHAVKRPSYYIAICGINANGVPCAAYFNPESDTAYFWQCADRKAVKSILNNPENAYDWSDVKNGIKVNV